MTDVTDERSEGQEQQEVPLPREGQPRTQDFTGEDPGPPSIEIQTRIVGQRLWARKWITILALVWMGSGIVCFIVVAGITLYFWVAGGLTDLPPAVKWLFGLWAGTEVVGAGIVWRPIRYWFESREP